MTAPPSGDAIVDLVPFLRVRDVNRSIRFYEALGFTVVKRYAPQIRLEFAGLRSTSAAKVMLARVDEVPKTGPDAQTPGFLYLYTHDLVALRKRLLDLEIQADEIEDGPGPGPNRQMCVRDPDGHGYMIAELWPDSIGEDPRPSAGPISRLIGGHLRRRRRRRGHTRGAMAPRAIEPRNDDLVTGLDRGRPTPSAVSSAVSTRCGVWLGLAPTGRRLFHACLRSVPAKRRT